jgi:hypothetical protein
MSFKYLADPSRPTWAGLLPGEPATYFLGKGEGEHAKLFGDTFSVPLSGDETGGQFGIFTAVPWPPPAHALPLPAAYSGSDHMLRGAPEVPADALDRTIDFLRRML